MSDPRPSFWTQLHSFSLIPPFIRPPLSPLYPQPPPPVCVSYELQYRTSRLTLCMCELTTLRFHVHAPPPPPPPQFCSALAESGHAVSSWRWWWLHNVRMSPESGRNDWFLSCCQWYSQCGSLSTLHYCCCQVLFVPIIARRVSDLMFSQQIKSKFLVIHFYTWSHCRLPDPKFNVGSAPTSRLFSLETVVPSKHTGLNLHRGTNIITSLYT